MECERYINVHNEQKRVIATGGNSITMHWQSQKNMLGHTRCTRYPFCSSHFVCVCVCVASARVCVSVDFALLWSLCHVSCILALYSVWLELCEWAAGLFFLFICAALLLPHIYQCECVCIISLLLPLLHNKFGARTIILAYALAL